jgi:Glycosyl transferase family 90
LRERTAPRSDNVADGLVALAATTRDGNETSSAERHIDSDVSDVNVQTQNLREAANENSHSDSKQSDTPRDLSQRPNALHMSDNHEPLDRRDSVGGERHEHSSLSAEVHKDSESPNLQSHGARDLAQQALEEPLHVKGSTGRLGIEEVKTHYRNLAKRYLSTFRTGIHRHMFFDVLRRRTYSLTPPGANKGVQSILFQIIDSRVYIMDPYEVPKNSKPFYRSRINEIIWLLSRLAKSGRIKNTEFLVSIHDCVQTVNKPHTYRGATYQESVPAFTIVSCNFSDNIPFPMWEGGVERGGGFEKWDDNMHEFSSKTQSWSEKEDLAVFRGGNRPSMFFQNKSDSDSQCDRVGRSRLVHLASQHPTMLDVSVGGTCGGVHMMLNRMNELDQQKYKYVLYAEGNCFWADRLNKQVFGPSLIVKQETPCKQFWEPLLAPMTHYLPTDFFFDNLIEQLQWARTNDEKVQEIVRNANEFAHNFLTLGGIEAYAEVLLAEYTSLLVEPDVKLENGALEVTDKHV